MENSTGTPDTRPVLTDLAFAPGSDLVACATLAGLDLRTWPALALVRAWPASSPAWRKVRFHPGGRRIAVTGLDAPLTVLDLDADRETRLGGAHYSALAYDAGGTLHAHDADGIVAWEDGSRLGVRITPHSLEGRAWIWDRLLLPGAGRQSTA